MVTSHRRRSSSLVHMQVDMLIDDIDLTYNKIHQGEEIFKNIILYLVIKFWFVQTLFHVFHRSVVIVIKLVQCNVVVLR